MSEKRPTANPFRLPKRKFSVKNHDRLRDIERRKAYNKLSVSAKVAARPTMKVVRSNILPARRAARQRLTEKSRHDAQYGARRSHEGIVDFLAKKREVCKMGMSINAAMREMKLLEERARAKEEALQTSKALLEEDSMRFDAFMRDHDAREKSKDRELQEQESEILTRDTKIKELLRRIHEGEKRIKAQRMELGDMRKYKAFCESLTPASHVKDNVAARSQAFERLRARDDGAEYGDFEAPDEAYFVREGQMEAKFRELEEANLFSIQQLQETESKLDQLRRAHDELKQSMGRQITTVDAQLKVLQEGLEAQKRKNAQLGAGGIRSELKEIDPRRLLRRLTEYVESVYKKLLPVSDIANTDVLGQIRDMEGWLNGLLLRADSMAPKARAVAEKRNELKKRKIAVQHHLAEQAALQEERKRSAIARMQMNLKPLGKPPMFRSKPPKKKTYVEKNLAAEAARKKADEYRKFFTLDGPL